MNKNSFKNITGAATTTFAGTELTKVILHGIAINKTTIGTITLKRDTTDIGIIAAGTLPGMYWHSEMGVFIDSLTIVNAAAENFTVFYTTF